MVSETNVDPHNHQLGSALTRSDQHWDRKIDSAKGEKKCFSSSHHNHNQRVRSEKRQWSLKRLRSYLSHNMEQEVHIMEKMLLFSKIHFMQKSSEIIPGNILPTVRLPSTAYPPQQRMVKLIIQAINRRKSLIVESPNGTGKTMCLLSSTLEAVEQKGIQRVYYLTRTHTQMNSIIGEIKKTDYHPKFAIAQSKKSLCVHQPVIRAGESMNYEDFNQICDQAQSGNLKAEDFIEQCPMKTKTPELPEQTELLEFPEFQTINNQDDLRRFAQKQGYCPQKYQLSLVKRAQLIIMPYIYMLNKFIFAAKKLSLENSVIIFDEAHNVLELARTQSNILINSNTLSPSLDEISGIRGMVQDQMLVNSLDDQLKTKYKVVDKVDKICTRISDFTSVLQNHYAKTNNTHVIMTLVELLAITKVTYTDFQQLTDEQNKILFKLKGEFKQKISQFGKKRIYFNNLIQINNRLREAMRMQSQHHFYVCVLYEQGKEGEEQFKVKFHCKSPYPVFERLNRSQPTFIFASGTLNIAEFKETRLNFLNHFSPDYPKQNPYPNNNVETYFIKEYQGQSLEIRYRLSNIDLVAKYIQQVSETIPNGILVFFKSIDYLTKFRKYITDFLIDFNRPTFFESGENFQQIITSYKKAALKEQGAILFGYMRGKASEGCNFENYYARAVFVVGMPFSYLHSIESRIHKFMDDFNTWYQQGAMLAVNQAIGRVVRHQNDYGLVFLLGQRLCEFQRKLPKWIQYNTKYDGNSLNMAQTKSNIARFFESRVQINPVIQEEVSLEELDYEVWNQEEDIGEEKSQSELEQPQQHLVRVPFKKNEVREQKQYQRRQVQKKQQKRQQKRQEKRVNALIVRPIDLNSDSQDDLQLAMAIKRSKHDS